MTKPVPADTLSRLKAVLGEGGWSQDPDRLAPKLQEWRGRWTGETPLLALPRSTAQVAAVVGICAADGVAITPQGGNTGLVAGQIPRGEILLSTEKLTAVRDVDAFDDVMVLEAGVTLAKAHEVALSVNRRFPLSLASEGSCTIGGLASTNAGGTAVLRYGVMRDQILGIEAVLPNGEVWNGLKRLRKDNTGYDLKHLLIGAEGTLGVITAASLKLHPLLASRCVAIAAVATPHDAIALLARAKDETGGAVEAFELMSRLGVAFAIKNIPGLREPLEAVHPWYVLVETASGEPGAAEAAMERLLAGALETGLIQDAAIAQTEAQAHAFWAVRENQSGGQKPEGAAWKHDVSVPVSKVADFIDQATAAVEKLSPGVRVVAFGHVGDGNVHYDVLRADGGADDPHDALRDEGARIVHDIVAGMDGSISAEHGLGAMKSAEALRYKSPVEVEALRAVRAALDPKRIMNPRVLF
ncbi:FAD-binding oxidoreductase [Caulobacter sp. UNC279MFTsu5.1]|uniref:FAD-binding oxidoreductase n=1 Tax=Caulobacter sp. UNC279MFTsu5.1 TaxID=1502775 RepID=UPI0008DFDAE9|nr:FAD-binding oxidoreductase [Caulobacter sp. UNC279MFTsu5.1]SFI68009.1 FAD/FMN-containing dehydrogenase [Caulobacter sp. UNC279MFTsu5.1]